METLTIKWHYSDIQAQAENDCYKLTKKQACEILEQIEDKLDCNLGVTWDVISCHIQEYCEENNIIPKGR